ncbi:hypothetical protein EDC01DRAFT_664348 [Geopyxis carbonaria]|nr:hypothetical protein EDC01DRAFT_664348 [Geopyxis carbonaria]
MPRSVADATRFTPTGPHASETPQQRVARLRSAAREAKATREAGTLMDRIVERGRYVADKAHRITALTLIGATVVAGGITVFAITDLMLHNRRKRAERLAEVQAARTVPADTPTSALPAATPGAVLSTSTPSERTPAPAAQLAPRQGPWEKFKGWAMSGMTPADQEYKVAMLAHEEERKNAARLMTPVIVEATRSGQDHGDRIDRLGADDLVKGEKEAGGSTGVVGSLTGWWSGR